jgi:uncharacterized protein
MFDRAYEWSRVAEFAMDPRAGAQLGIVTGRRRQGKTFLLRALCQATGGFYFAAEEAADGESLRRIGSAIAEHLGAPAPLHLPDWHAVLDVLLAFGRDRPIPIVIDELPYLVKANPSLPSIIQQAFAPLRPEPDTSRARILLCGSALSFMGRLLAGSAPLRGRVGLELVVPTLDYRLASEFWGIDDPRTALKVNAIVGGTPAYRREYARDDTPSDPGDFDSWVVRTVLSPTSPLFREAHYLLADEPDIRDTGLYHSVLAAIAQGSATRGGIASYLGRKSGELAHPLSVLEDCGLIRRERDLFREKRSTFHIAEPLVTFYHAVMRPIWSDLEHIRDATELWQRSRRRYLSNVLGPHLEQVCRYWTRHLAPPELFGGLPPTDVRATTVHDPVHRIDHQLDVAVSALDDDGRAQVLGLGEVKCNEVMGPGDVERLRRIRALLTAQGRPGAATARLACYSMAGFAPELVEIARRSDEIVLVGLDTLYGGEGRGERLVECRL